jgi:Rps23 Pro-64 3,4-dihydroxylase Tpa1-like proline 4-hydroxylase
MKLIYNLQDRMYVINNFLPFGFYKSLHKMVWNTKKYESSKDHWDLGLINNLRPVETFVLSNDVVSKIEILYRHQIFVKIEKNFNFHFTFHKMSYGSGINWHDDSNHSWAFTYYINKRWNTEWGGEFMFDHEGNKGFVPVMPNSLVILKQGTQHKVNPVLSKNFPRLSLQCFVDTPEQIKINEETYTKRKNNLVS